MKNWRRPPKNIKKQAGLSRATLEISSEFSSKNSLVRLYTLQLDVRRHFEDFWNMVWSSKLKFKVWVRSNKWLLRHSTSNILRSSSIGGRLHFKDLKILLGHLSLRLKFEYDPVRGCWDIPILIFWGRLPLDVVFIKRICKISFGHLGLGLKFDYDPMIGSWDIQHFKVGGRLAGWVDLTDNNTTS